MATNTALKRAQKTEQQIAEVDAKTAKTIAQSWMNINAVEESLARMDTGIVQWRATPAVQNAMAAMVADMVTEQDKIMVGGIQPYAWMRACGMPLSDILSVQLGKMLPQNVMGATTDDMCDAMKAGNMVVAVMHIDTAKDWQDVRTVSAAAVKAEAPAVIMISASVDAPKGVAVEMSETWADAAVNMRAAINDARKSKAIRVVAVSDMDSGTLEMAMMEAAGMSAEDWQNMVQKNADGAEIAVNAAYQAPVKSF